MRNGPTPKNRTVSKSVGSATNKATAQRDRFGAAVQTALRAGVKGGGRS